MEIDSGQRKCPGEGRGIQPLQAWGIPKSQARRSFVGRLDAGLQYPSQWLVLAGLHPDAGERIGRRGAFIRPVEDLPIPELSTTAKAEASGGDTAEWERDHLQMTACENTRERNVDWMRRRRLALWGVWICRKDKEPHSQDSYHGVATKVQKSPCSPLSAASPDSHLKGYVMRSSTCEEHDF